jgi:uncharacterized membrane protein
MPIRHYSSTRVARAEDFVVGKTYHMIVSTTKTVHWVPQNNYWYKINSKGFIYAKHGGKIHAKFWYWDSKNQKKKWVKVEHYITDVEFRKEKKK